MCCAPHACLFTVTIMRKISYGCRSGMGSRGVGMVDFQDAVAGHAAYDLISLLEDARRDVSPELADAMTAHYLAGPGPLLQPRRVRFRCGGTCCASQCKDRRHFCAFG